jgi:hypothetical protein
MNMTEPITNHDQLSVLALGAPFWGKPRIAAVVKSHADQIQELENVAWQIIDSLKTPSGARLDERGRLLSVPRVKWSDDEYRARLAVQMAVNRSEGARGDIYNILGILGLLPLKRREIRPLRLRVFFDKDRIGAPFTSEVVADALGDAVHAGVAVEVVSPSVAGVEPFTLASATAPEAFPGTSLASADGVVVGAPLPFIVLR